jgi:hypothetical protein
MVKKARIFLVKTLIIGRLIACMDQLLPCWIARAAHLLFSRLSWLLPREWASTNIIYTNTRLGLAPGATRDHCMKITGTTTIAIFTYICTTCMLIICYVYTHIFILSYLLMYFRLVLPWLPFGCNLCVAYNAGATVAKLGWCKSAPMLRGHFRGLRGGMWCLCCSNISHYYMYHAANKM